jgi:hypothetical protein
MLFLNGKTNETKNQLILASGPNPVTCQVASTASPYRTAQDRTSHMKFIAEYSAALKPEGMVEIQLSQRLAQGIWRINRAHAIEENIFALIDSEPLAKIKSSMKLLTQVSVYRQKLTRNFHINMELLLRLQSLRPDSPEKEKAIAASAYAA